MPMHILVSMPSRANASLLRGFIIMVNPVAKKVSMPSRANASLLLKTILAAVTSMTALCQCHLGLMPHCYENNEKILGDWQCVSMPSRANASLLH